MKRQLIWIFLFVLLLSFIPNPAFAAPRTQGDDPQGQADALYEEGVALYDQGDYEAAINRLEEALTIYQDIGNQEDEAATLHLIAQIYNGLSQYDLSLDNYQQALAIMRKLDDKEGAGRTLNNIGGVYFNSGQYSEALDYFQKALTLSQEVGDRQGEGATLSGIGAVYYSSEQYLQSLDSYQQALAIAQETGDQPAEVNRLNCIGTVYYKLGQYPQALDSFRQGLRIAQEIGDRVTEGLILGDMGSVYDAIGEYQQALDYRQQALAVVREIDNRGWETEILTGLGQTYNNLGQYEQALDYFQKALAGEQEMGDRAGEAVTLSGLGQTYKNLGQYELALNYFQKALGIKHEMGDRSAEAVTLNGIGQTYADLGQYEQALDYHQQALVILQGIGDQVGEGRALTNIAVIYSYLGQSEKALDYHQQALAIEKQFGDRPGEAATLGNIGMAYEALNQYEQALNHDQSALTLVQEIGDRLGEAVILSNIGLVYEDLDQPEQALDYYQKALGIQQEIGDRAGEAETLNSMGWLSKKQSKNDQALSYAQQAVEVIESIHSELKVEELKASFASEYSDTYELLVGLLWNEGRFEDAFNYVERARARAFLDQLAGGNLDFRAGGDINLLEQEKSLRNEIAALHSQLITLRNRPLKELDTDMIASVEDELHTQEADYAKLFTNIKLQSPEVAELVSVDVASLADIQSLLDSNTTLVEYFVMEDRTLVFIVTRGGFETSAVAVNKDDLTQTISDFREFASLDDAHPASLKQLYNWLIAPIKDKLKTPIVGIISHSVLHYLPFAALTDGKQYLGDEYSLFTLPSASALRFIQEKRKPVTNTLLALGNPTTTEPGLAPLQFAQNEVETIANMFGTKPLIGDSATESALRAQAGGAGILHLAAHGQYNPSNPLFSAIYLAEDQNEDGRLEVNEIYGLDLTKSTDLVVLSACQTDVGAISAGDEVVGMTRAFLYAGTPTVIASLWKVDDQATTLLMEQFYSHLHEGMGKAQALQQAQSEVRVKYTNPYYWAAFVLTGDPGAVKVANSIQSNLKDNQGLLIVIIIGILLLLFGGLTVFRNRRKRGES